ncbi:MAG: rhomboid family intramembrane serine protease [Planctomycetota bacterium]
MFLPLGDSPNVPRRAWVTWALIAVNVVVYLALLPMSYRRPEAGDPRLARYVAVIERIAGREEARAAALEVTEHELFVFEHGFKPDAPRVDEVLFAMFLHGGLLHLAGNCLFLWIFGDNVEHRLGRGRFLGAYLLTGALAAGGDLVLRHGSPLPSVGASGAISGVLGLYFVWFPRNVVRVWLLVFPIWVGEMELPARIVLGFYLVVDNVLPALVAGGEGGVSYGAHIGGFLAGALLAVAVARIRARLPRGGDAPLELASDDVAQAFSQAVREGQLARALQLLALHRSSRAGALPAADLIALGEALARDGAGSAAETVLGFAVRAAASPEERVCARLRLAAAALERGDPVASYQHARAAEDEALEPEARAELLALRERLGATLRVLPAPRPSPAG